MRKGKRVHVKCGSEKLPRVMACHRVMRTQNETPEAMISQSYGHRGYQDEHARNMLERPLENPLTHAEFTASSVLGNTSDRGMFSGESCFLGLRKMHLAIEDIRAQSDSCLLL